MKTRESIESLVAFARRYMLKEDNLQEVAMHVICHVGLSNILSAYEVSVNFSSRSIHKDICLSIITELLTRK